jgi:hypothetical protein
MTNWRQFDSDFLCYELRSEFWVMARVAYITPGWGWTVWTPSGVVIDRGLAKTQRGAKWTARRAVNRWRRGG